jgi:hypothetical protein
MDALIESDLFNAKSFYSNEIIFSRICIILLSFSAHLCWQAEMSEAPVHDI